LSGEHAEGPREYLAGHGKGKYTIADMCTWPWVQDWEFAGFTKEEMDVFPNLLSYIERIGGRSAAQKGIGDKYETAKLKQVMTEQRGKR